MSSYIHTYSITSLPRRSLGEHTGVITEIHVAIHTTDGSYDDQRQAFVFALPADALAPPFVDLEDLDKETIIGWIASDVRSEWEAVMERRVAAIALRAAADVTADVPPHLL